MEGIRVGQHYHLAALVGGEVQVVVGVELAHRLGIDAQTVLEQFDKTLRQSAPGDTVQVPDQILVLGSVEIDFLMFHAAYSFLKRETDPVAD
ncbi:hypothetical protein D9M68_833740 [compost metagenome]